MNLVNQRWDTTDCGYKITQAGAGIKLMKNPNHLTLPPPLLPNSLRRKCSVQHGTCSESALIPFYEEKGKELI